MCRVMKTAPRCALARAERSSNDGLSLPSRVRTTWKPCASSARFVAVANCKTSSLSLMPSVPRAPGSVPPCAGSRTTIFNPERPAGAVGVLDDCCDGIEFACAEAAAEFAVDCTTFAAEALLPAACCGAAHASAAQHTPAPRRPPARICRQVREDLTPSRISNLNALVDARGG